MKVAAFRAVLAAAEGLYQDGGNETAARALSLLAHLLAARDAMTVAAFAAMLAKAPIADDVGMAAGAPTVAQLKKALDGLRSFCEAAGGKTAERDFKTLADALEAHAALPVEAFAARMQAWQSEAAAKSKRHKAGAGKSEKARPALSEDALNAAVDAHVTALRNAGIDRATFAAALATLKFDKSLKSAAVAEIARRYADTVTKYKSMAAAHADIASAFTQRARFASKVGSS